MADAESEQGGFAVVEASIDQISEALSAGRTTSVELVAAYLNRIAAYDRRGPRLNSTPVLNPACFAEARQADRARQAAARARPRQQPHSAAPVLSALHGVPFTVKDSYKVAGLTVAAGSPAFARLVARDDAFAVAALRQHGAVVLGKTNMPPMAVGGCQRGVYGRAESPYNPDFLPAAWHSGSSSGSGVAVAASLCAFGLGEETVSSGRSPASNGGLVAYTPSRGLISVRGNWPLFPLRDTVVPHTRCVRDLLHLLNALVADDPAPAGDLWRTQPFVALPPPASVRPADFVSLATPGALRGRRLGVPRMYVGRDPAADAPIPVRPSILQRMDEARAVLARLGATCVEVDLPVVSAYETDRPGTRSLVARGLLPAGWNEQEINDLVSASWEEFLRCNGDPACPSLAGVHPWVIHADPPDAVDTRRTTSAHDGEDQIRYDYIVDRVRRQTPPQTPLAFPQLGAVCAGLERARRELFEQWLADRQLDGIVFPANADVAPAHADTDEHASRIAWRNGVVFSNMNHVLRHLGIPSVTVTMGRMADTGMPVGLTLAAAAYADQDLLRWAYDYEAASALRVAPAAVPELGPHGCASSPPPGPWAGDDDAPLASVALELSGSGVVDGRGDVRVQVETRVSTTGVPHGPEAPALSVRVTVDGRHHAVYDRTAPPPFRDTLATTVTIPASERRGARLQASLVVVTATLVYPGGATGQQRVTEGAYMDVPYQFP